LAEDFREVEDVAETELVGELLKGEGVLVDRGAGVLDAAPFLEVGGRFPHALGETLAETLVTDAQLLGD